MTAMVALPALFLILAWIALLQSRSRPSAGRALLRACVLSGVWLVAITELLSLGRLLTPAAVAAGWGLPLVVLLIRAIRSRGSLPSITREVRSELSENLGLTAGVGVVFAITALVAYLAPPQTWDSLNYHMARVAHWAQLRAVAPFATGIEVQNSRSPGAEFATLHLYLLGGGDRWVNFAQWAAMVGSVIGVGGLAAELGASRRGAVLASAFAAALPMGIVQASSTMTDYVTTLWLVAVAGEVIGAGREPSPAASVAFAGAGAGLAFLSKPTSGPYLLALGVLGIWVLMRRRPGLRSIASGMVVGGMVFVVLNLGHAARSVAIYGDPISGGDQLGVHANQRGDIPGLISNTIRNLGLHAGTPSPHVNKALTLAAWAVHDLLGVDPDDPRTTAHGRFEIDETTTNENKSGNLVGLVVGGVAGLFVLGWRRRFPPEPAAYLLALIGAFVVFCGVFKWQVFGSRYHLPFFVLLAPLVGVAVAHAFTRRGLQATAWLLLAGGLPWLLSVDSRPILPRPGVSSVGSVLGESRNSLYFANGVHLERPYTEMTAAVLGAGCGRVGLSLTGNGAEYPLWYLLGAPRGDLEIEWLVAGTPSARYAEATFQPCAVICDGCGSGGALIRGLPQAYAFDTFRLYLRPEPSD